MLWESLRCRGRTRVIIIMMYKIWENAEGVQEEHWTWLGGKGHLIFGREFARSRVISTTS
jgi:hypothetical protein